MAQLCHFPNEKAVHFHICPFFCVSKVTDLGKEMHLHLSSYCVISIFVTSSFCHHFGTVTSSFFFFSSRILKFYFSY